MRVKVKLSELIDADANFVSIVARGANRIPFRIVKAVKEPKDMASLDLSSITSVIKRASAKADTQPIQPTLSGIVILKGDEAETEAAITAIKAMGFNVDSPKEQGDGAVLFAQDADPENGAEVVRYSDDLVLLVKNMDSTEAKAAADFSEITKDAGFLFGPIGALEALKSKLAKTEDPLEQAAASGKFAQYMAAVTKSLPDSAIKLDVAVTKAMRNVRALANQVKSKPRPVTPGVGGSQRGISHKPSPALKAAYDPDGDGDDDSKDTKPASISQADWDKMTPAQRAAACAKKEDEPKQDVTPDFAAIVDAKLNPITEALKNITTVMEALQKTQKDQEAAIKEAKATAEATQKTVKGTVLAAAISGDNPAHDVDDTKTDDVDPFAGTFDTAYMRKSARGSWDRRKQ